MKDLDELQRSVIKFRDERNWKQFHNPKDMAISLLLEAAEFLEHFQWKNEAETKKHLSDNHEAVSDEVIDVLYWVLLIAHDLDIDLEQAFDRKMIQNAKKYAIDKAKNTHAKYTEL